MTLAELWDNQIVQLVVRLVAAAFLGAAIGYEREFRGKDAGVRTHMLVAMGACLFMLISKYGFSDSPRFDAARIAAGVVSGIGFLGGGLIIKSKANTITGLTTAAGLWVTASIGLGAGSGMLLMALICTVLVLACMEILNVWNFRLGFRTASAVFTSTDNKALIDVARQLDKNVIHSYLTKQGDVFKAEVILRIHKREKIVDLMQRLTSFDKVNLESLE